MFNADASEFVKLDRAIAPPRRRRRQFLKTSRCSGQAKRQEVEAGQRRSRHDTEQCQPGITWLRGLSYSAPMMMQHAATMPPYADRLDASAFGLTVARRLIGRDRHRRSPGSRSRPHARLRLVLPSVRSPIAASGLRPLELTLTQFAAHHPSARRSTPSALA